MTSFRYAARSTRGRMMPFAEFVHVSIIILKERKERSAHLRKVDITYVWV